MRLQAICFALILLIQAAAFAGPPEGESQGSSIVVSVVDPSNQPVAGVRVQLQGGNAAIASAETDQQGRAEFTQLHAAQYGLTATKQGFEAAQKAGLDLSEGRSISLELTLVPALTRQESIDVHDTIAPIEQSSSPAGGDLAPETAKELPSRPATVSDALPLIPGVVRSPEGGLRISGSGEHRSALIVNSADVTDPATGQFGLTVPIDSVDTMNVYQTPFLAEYGRFTAGLVSVETRRGGDKWKWELNDPFPEFRVRSWQLRGLRTATPRLNFEGPLIPGKLYFSEGFEYEIRKTPVFTLPFPENQKKQEGINSFAQIDWIASPKQLLTATIHLAPQHLEFANMDYFNPQMTSANAGTSNYTATVGDHLSIGQGLLDNTLSLTQFHARVWGQGPQDLTITPGGNTGNYFAQQDRNASRVSEAATYSLAPRTFWGTHNVKVGSYVAESAERGQVQEHPIDILNSSDQLIERITFSGGEPFRRSDTEFAFFGQDHWVATQRLAIDIGTRAESQELSESLRLAPRAGLAWSPFASSGTVFRAGLGLFYDRVPLNVYSFDRYPVQSVTMFGADGEITGGPFTYQNGLGEVSKQSPFIFRGLSAGNFSPHSTTWSVQAEQPLSRFLKLRASYMQSDSGGLVVLNTIPPDPRTNAGSFLLSGAGRAQYRQFELLAQAHWGGGRQMTFSYVRSRAQGDLNDFNNFLGTFPIPIVRGNEFGNLLSDLPNRFLAWGLIPLPAGFRIAPVFEFRSGFPYAVTDATQNYVGVPNQNRFPNFLSIDSRLSKDFKVNPKYTVRLSGSGYNLTNHFNPEAFHANISDPAYGLFFGQRGRRFTMDFDVIF